MEKLIVDTDGKLTIPPEIIKKRGLQPGDELSLIESDEGLLVYQGGVDEKTRSWWNSLTQDQRQMAELEARRYESLSEEEKNRMWSDDVESTETETEGDEIDLRAK
ncbi:MAG TPA: AbrB/MazE/SpoVT family DNA-binding domain-containing protein [Blastocatellia bacterium]|nr:AbrB/MazE/SpoVT family DNA-binding domain-containing protein [Blastocatellia bacterium]